MSAEIIGLIAVGVIALGAQFLVSLSFIGFTWEKVFVYAFEIGSIYFLARGLLYVNTANAVLIGLVVGTVAAWICSLRPVPTFAATAHDVEPEPDDQITFAGGTEARYPAQRVDIQV